MNPIKKYMSLFEKKLSPQQKKLWQLLLFLIKFGIASIPVYLIMAFNLDFFYIQNAEALQVNFIINSFGTNSSVMYCKINECNASPPGMPAIAYQDRAIGVDRACTGYRSFFALIGLILAVPGITKDKRLRGIFFALVVVYIANIIRLLSTFYLSFVFDFELVHNIMWREGMIAVVFFSWLLWMKKL
jgi:exosortase/archaeosortase family protein